VKRVTIPMNKNDHIKGSYCTERVLSNAGVNKNYDLTNIEDIIEKAVSDCIPNAYNVIVGKNFYYFECSEQPTLGQLIAMGRYISLKSGLYKLIKEYPSKSGNHPSTRVLFKTIQSEYVF
jgi:hypothetical protein